MCRATICNRFWSNEHRQCAGEVDGFNASTLKRVERTTLLPSGQRLDILRVDILSAAHYFPLDILTQDISRPDIISRRTFCRFGHSAKGHSAQDIVTLDILSMDIVACYARIQLLFRSFSELNHLFNLLLLN